jgi:hypothetical protein
MTRIEIPVSYRPHSGSTRTLVTKQVLTCTQMKTPSDRPDFGSIRVLVIQSNDQLIIFMDTQSCRPIIGSIDNLRVAKCMHPIQMKDTIRKFFNLGIQLGFQWLNQVVTLPFVWTHKAVDL